MSELWTPIQMPTTRKVGGGTHFDDELMTQEQHQDIVRDELIRLVEHINQRPDHVIYVGSTEERSKMRNVLNWWKREGAIGHNPDIRIDYGVAEGAIRIGEER